MTLFEFVSAGLLILIAGVSFLFVVCSLLIGLIETATAWLEYHNRYK